MQSDDTRSEHAKKTLTVEIRALAPEEADVAADVLADAFMASPVYLAILGHKDETQRRAALRRVKRGFIDSALHHYTPLAAHVGDTLAGIMLMMAPGEYPLKMMAELRQAYGCATVGPRAGINFLRLYGYTQKHHPKEPHFYLFVLGVHPAYQGKGIGRALLAKLHERVDEKNIAGYLETDLESNVRLYQSVGYRIVTDEEVPGLKVGESGLRYYTMRRPPASEPSAS